MNARARLKVGDRVSREVFIDDGTWDREGDSCLPRSPLRYGRVVKVAPEGWYRGIGGAPSFYSHALMYHVKWEDGGQPRRYFEHGVDLVANETFEHESAKEPDNA